METDIFFQEAINEARIGLSEGGIPIGSVLVVGNRIIGKGHNKRFQKGSPTLHAEIDCLENAGRLTPEQYELATLYTTLSPCCMCSGAILLYKIPRVVIGENVTFSGDIDHLLSNNVKVTILNDETCINMMKKFIAENKEIWNEDIGNKL